jgi:hypothetical protein
MVSVGSVGSVGSYNSKDSYANKDNERFDRRTDLMFSEFNQTKSNHKAKFGKKNKINKGNRYDSDDVSTCKLYLIFFSASFFSFFFFCLLS